MSELKSCPFCGVETYIKYEDMDGLYTSPVDFHGESEPWAIIYAEHKDGCWLKESDLFEWFETAAEAIETWNTRTERTGKRVGTKYREKRCQISWKCSECGFPLYSDHDSYCSECGAKVVS